MRPEELIGKELGQYRIEAKIGQGGMAAVFKAYQPSLNRYVAIKVLLPHLVTERPDLIRLFSREAEAIARLRHPHILPVYNYETDDHYNYIVMQYVEGGQTLKRLMDRPLSLERTIDLISQVAGALHHAHQHDMVHRDVKPGNILLDGDRALLTDFGLVKINAPDTDLTAVGMGTALYMSPEQGYGQKVDHRADIYSLGIILYQMLTGVIPHQADSLLATMMKRNAEAPIPPCEINAAIPAGVEHVTLRALALDPKDRYPSAAAFATALQKAAVDNTYRDPFIVPSDYEATVPSLKPPPRKRRAGIWPYLIGIVAMIIIAVGALAWRGFAAGSPVSQLDSTQTASIMAKAPMPADTPTASPTRTPTLTPILPAHTPTFTPSPAPTHTPVPPTATPTLSPTLSPTPSPSPTPTANPTVTPTLTPALPTGTFTLLNPDLEKPAFAYQLIDFEWEWIGTLPPELGFEVRVWREGEPQAGAHNAVLDNTEGRIEPIGENRYRLSIDITEAAGVRRRAGEYWWTVALVQVSPEYADLGQQAEPGLLRFEVPGGSGGDGDSGSGGGSTGSSSGGTGGIK
jgi:serine/threonine-protein kinase